MTANSGKNNNFNLLRFLFASLVIISHAPELQDGNRSREILTNIFGTISFGEMAVDSFFVVSGFLIAKSWQERPNVSAFLSSRVLRIYPGFVAASLICALIVGPVYGAPDYFQSFRPGEYLSSLIALKPPVAPSVFQGSYYPAVNAAMWSISYEFMCYLLLMVCGLVGVLKNRHAWLAIAVICAAVHIANRSGSIVLPLDQYFRCAMAFSFGGCFYLYRENIPWTKKLAWLAFFVFGILLFFKPLAEPALGVFWGYAIIYYANHGKRLLEFNRLPDISYGVYLYAWPINKMLYWHFPEMNFYAAMAVVFILSVLAGILSWYLVEKQGMRVKAIFRKKLLQPST